MAPKPQAFWDELTLPYLTLSDRDKNAAARKKYPSADSGRGAKGLPCLVFFQLVASGASHLSLGVDSLERYLLDRAFQRREARAFGTDPLVALLRPTPVLHVVENLLYCTPPRSLTNCTNR